MVGRRCSICDRNPATSARRRARASLDTCRNDVPVRMWIILRVETEEREREVARLVIPLRCQKSRIVLASRVSAIIQLGEFRVRHEMSSFYLVSSEWRRGRRRRRIGREMVKSRDTQSSGGSRGSCNSGSVPFSASPPLPLFTLHAFLFLFSIFRALGEIEVADSVCSPSHFPSKLLLALGAAVTTAFSLIYTLFSRLLCYL